MLHQLYQSIYHENEDTLVDEANECLMDNYGVAEVEDLPSTVLRFAERDLVEEGISRELPLSDITSSFPSFERLFLEKWKTNMAEDLNNTVQSLTVKVHEYLSDFIGISQRRETEVFFDIGIEVRLEQGNSLLIDPSKLLPVLIQQSKEW